MALFGLPRKIQKGVGQGGALLPVLVLLARVPIFPFIFSPLPRTVPAILPPSWS